MAKRVHQLAKELGVKSTAIVAKCQAESLDIKNHMSTLSAGLEATIREWFSEGEHLTTVEETERVDLAKVKVKKKVKRVKKTKMEAEQADAGEPGEAEAAPAAVAVAAVMEAAGEPEAEGEAVAAALDEPAEEKPKRVSPKELAEGEAAEETETPEEPSIEPAAAKTEPEVVAEKPAEVVPPEPPKPFVPKPAKLQGPTVIRVERPDVIRPAPPRAPRKTTIQPAAADAPVGDGSVAKGKDGKDGKRGRKRQTRLGGQETDWGARRPKTKTSRRSARGGEVEVLGAPHEPGNLDLQERQARLAQASGAMLHQRERRLARRDKDGKMVPITAPRRIEAATIKEPVTIRDLSAVIGIRSGEIMAKLMGMGIMAAVNQPIDTEAAVMISLEFGVELNVEAKRLLLDELQSKFDEEVPEDKLRPRPPVAAFLGHVDHGKTSLLDHIRRSTVANGEAGGITQHIGSYLYDDGKRRVTFLDTPGHAAFTAMRARGADMTDIVVLVVAADDGVMPQTAEAINHANAAGVPMLVAMNKIDLPNTDENRVLGELAEKGLVPTEWGGTTEVVRTSATTGEGLTDLVEHLDYVAELLNLRAQEDGPATGWVVESEMTIGQGAVSRMLMKQGTLKPGDVIVSGSVYGRVRTIKDATGKAIKQAGPSMPIEVTGVNEVPTAGNRFFVVDDISKAAEIAAEQRSREREVSLAQRRNVTLENLFSEIKAGELKELNVIVKADVQGSVDVLQNSVVEMNTEEVAVRILHSAVGGISESDVLLAEASNAIIIGFQVVADDRARSLAETSGVEIRLYRVIYQISDDIKQALEGMLTPRLEEKMLGSVEVRNTFRISRIGVIAGCYVTDGLIPRSSKVRLIRDSIVVRDGLTLESLRRVKDDVSEVRNGFECGLKLAGFDDIQVGDKIEAYEMIEISRTLASSGAETGGN